MTFKQILRNLTKNSVRFAKEGDALKAQACIDLATLIKTRGYETIRGKIELSV